MGYLRKEKSKCLDAIRIRIQREGEFKFTEDSIVLNKSCKIRDLDPDKPEGIGQMTVPTFGLICGLCMSGGWGGASINMR